MNPVGVDDMDTYQVNVEGNQIFAFEVKNKYITIKKVISILSMCNGVSDINKLSKNEGGNEILVRFKYQNTLCVVWEPFGDSDRYWIGFENDNEKIDLKKVEHIFMEYKLNKLLVLIADIITLDFFSLIKSIKSNN